MIVGIGTDIEAIARFKNMWLSKPSLLSKLFFSSEYEYALKKEKPWETLAGIWCAKESVVKSLSREICLGIKEVEIFKPSPEGFQVYFQRPEMIDTVFRFWISVSHTKDYATAICVVEK